MVLQWCYLKRGLAVNITTHVRRRHHHRVEVIVAEFASSVARDLEGVKR
jgi:hypothetical protein